jgi:hypothetical protein
MTRKPTTKREPPGLAYAREACRRLHEAGKTVSTRAVLAEVAKSRGVKVSFRDATPAVAMWRTEQMARVSGRVESAVDALLALETDLERDMVRRAVKQRTGGGVQIKFTVASRATRKDPSHTGLPKRAG